MDSKKEKVYLKLSHIGRDYEDEWKKSDQLDLAVWQEAAYLLKHWEYSHDGCEIKVQANWQPYVDRLKEQIEIHNHFFAKLERKESFDDFDFGNSEDLIIECEVTIKGANEVSNYGWYPGYFVEQYAYDLFLIMNLAMPGCCDFYNLIIVSDNGKQKDRLNLSGYSFQSAWQKLSDNHWIKLQKIPLSEVNNWYRNLNLGVRQKAETDAEKVVFSLLHLCKIDVDVIAIIWVFHALETIYKTRVGEGFPNLFNRISILLQLDSKEKSNLKKTLRKMYDLRSSVVHGGYEVLHPIHQEVIDRRLNDDVSNIIDLSINGFMLVAKSVQCLISRGWVGLTITESMDGVKSHNNRLSDHRAS